jgi:tRNA-binding protein
VDNTRCSLEFRIHGQGSVTSRIFEKPESPQNSTIRSMPIAPVKSAVSIELLDQIDVRVGRIQAVEDVPGSDKLVQLRVNFGDHTRTIVAGLRQERASPREVEGKQALFVVNLEPRKIRGVVSEGMLFDIGYADGIRPVLAVPEVPVPDGTRAG